MTDWSLMFGFCIQLNILNFNQMIKQRNKEFLASKETWMQENGLDKFRTIVSEVSSFVGSLVHAHAISISTLTTFNLRENAWSLDISFTLHGKITMGYPRWIKLNLQYRSMQDGVNELISKLTTQQFWSLAAFYPAISILKGIEPLPQTQMLKSLYLCNLML